MFVLILSPELYKTITLVVMGVFRQSKRHTKDNFNEKNTGVKIRIMDRKEIQNSSGDRNSGSSSDRYEF